MIWSFYWLGTGIFTGQTFSGARLVASNIPVGCNSFEGQVDHRQHRLDISTGQLVDYTPVAEDEGILQSRLIGTQMAEIEALERLQLRSLSDLFDDPNDQDARENYTRRKSRIGELRQLITVGKETIVRAVKPR